MERASKWTRTKLLLVIISVFQCNGVSLRRQLQHIADSHAESQGFPKELVPSRRHFYNYDPRELSSIIGSPSMPSHLPEAEPILPGHTLIKPALGMLKSAVKFPHRDLEDGSGVYGNYENIGIRYDSKNERVLYSGFRRMPSNGIIIDPAPELRSNKITLYPNDNKEPPTKKNNIGRMYLNRIYASKLPGVYNDESRRNIFNNKKLKNVIHAVQDKIKNFGERVKRFFKQRTNYKKYNSNKKKRVMRSNFENTDSKENEDMKINLIITEELPAKDNRFWNHQNTFNHVAIDQTAPDYEDLFPPHHDNTRQWWFFNEADWQRPLQT